MNSPIKPEKNPAAETLMEELVFLRRTETPRYILDLNGALSKAPDIPREAFEAVLTELIAVVKQHQYSDIDKMLFGGTCQGICQSAKPENQNGKPENTGIEPR